MHYGLKGLCSLRMKAARPTRIFALLCGLLVAAGVPAQEDEEQAAELPVAPVPSSLQQDWWEYFEGTPQEVEQRIGIFAAQVNEQISGLGAQNQQRAPAIVQAVRDNLQVYLSLLGDVEIQPQELPERAAAYSLDELLQTAATAREARVAANAAEMQEVVRAADEETVANVLARAESGENGSGAHVVSNAGCQRPTGPAATSP